MPHAWKAGAQTLLLRRQIEAMRDGGLVVIVVPPRPIRCPPAPYERAALIAYYLKRRKPRAKVVILDANDWYPMQKLIEPEWARRFGGMISWVPAAAGGTVERIDLKKRAVISEVENIKGDVVNFIPRHHAGAIAVRTGVSGPSGWCPIKPASLESTLFEDVHVVGDACEVRAMSKTAHGAVSQAKVVAGAIAATVAGRPLPTPYFTVVGYLMMTPEAAVSGTQVLGEQDGEIETIEDAGGVSPVHASDRDREIEAKMAKSWYRNLTADAFL
jgi:sulfide dehydrogenase [flavocytochrome c] flavoprotein subunit